jgi:multidrug efflux pump
VLGGMIAVVILALLMVPVFFVALQRLFARDREAVEKPETAEQQGAPASIQ